MMGLNKNELNHLEGIFIKVPHVERAVLFGSRAIGTHRNGSDVDIAVYGSGLSSLDILTLLHLVEETMLPYMFDFIIPEADNIILSDHINTVGIEIYRSTR